MFTASIYFLGEYRPAYFQAATLAVAVSKAERALFAAQDRDWFLTRLHEGKRQVRKPNCAGWSAEHGCRGVAIVKRPHDPFLDSITVKLPHYPGLDYTVA